MHRPAPLIVMVDVPRYPPFRQWRKLDEPKGRRVKCFMTSRSVSLERAGPLILVAGLIALWEFLERWLEVPRFLLPAPSDIARLMVAEHALIWMHATATIWSIVSGYVAAVVFALAISALMIRYPFCERLIMPIFVALQSVPKIAIAPLILVWVGAGIGSKVLVVASIAFFPIVIN